MIVTISVTAEDIAKGKPGQACDCPIWHAIARALPWLPQSDDDGLFSVGPLGVCGIGSGLESIDLPQEVYSFIGRFDSVLPVEPFEFDLDIPDHLVPAGAVPAGGEH